jgi:hypothetical protein
LLCNKIVSHHRSILGGMGNEGGFQHVSISQR